MPGNSPTVAQVSVAMETPTVLGVSVAYVLGIFFHLLSTNAPLIAAAFLEFHDVSPMWQ